MLPVLVYAATDVPNPAAAPIGQPPLPPDNDAPRKARNGVALGLTLGTGFARGAGYPNDLNAIGVSHYASSRWLPGYSGSLLLMGAISDFVNVGPWFTTGKFRNSTESEAQFGIGLRVEGFPLLRLYPTLAGLGVFAEFGIGTAHLERVGVPEVGGTQSFIGTGVFYEWAFGRVLGGHFGAGPSLEYDAVFTQPYDQNGLVASARFVWYGGP